MSESVKVIIRVRPMNALERQRNSYQIVQIDQAQNQVTLKKPGESDNNKAFAFDTVFHSKVNQALVYEQTAFNLVESVVQGYNGTIFAYGQTGCGKTHTMMGCPDNQQLKGIIPRTFSHILNIVDTFKEKSFLIQCSFIEIYNQEIHDLLSKDTHEKKEIKEDAKGVVYVKDLNKHVVKSVEQMDQYMLTGFKNRATGETLMNKDSSRSHSIFTLYIQSSYTDETGEKFTAGKLNLVDLAGSERQSKTKAEGQRLKEATKINLSLSALGNVISALVDGKSSHIPYRDSKLTRLLQDSLGGNTKTIMIANISPADYNFDQTLSTLRYASRAKFIKNKPIVNEDPKDAMLRQYLDQIKKLKQILKNGGSEINLGGNENSQKSNLANSNSQTKIHPDYALQLQQKDELYKREKQQREKIEESLKKLEQQMLHAGNHPQSDTEKYKQLRAKLKLQKQEQKKLIAEKQKNQSQMYALKSQYKTLQEEVDEYKKIILDLRNKYQNAIQDTTDIQKQNEVRCDDLLENIRQQDKEIKFYKKMIAMLLRPQQIEVIKSSSEWNDDQREYNVPAFTLKEKKIYFPRLHGERIVQDFIRHEQQKKQIKFIQQPSKDTIKVDSTTLQRKKKHTHNNVHSKGHNNIHNNTTTTIYEKTQSTNNIKFDPIPKFRLKNIQLTPIGRTLGFQQIDINKRVILNPITPNQKDSN